MANWSLIYPDKCRAELSPAYDLVSTIPYIDGDATAALNYSRTKKMAEFSADEPRHLAATALLPEKLVIDAATETVRRFREVWDAEKRNLPMAAKVTKMIDAHAPTIPVYGELA